MEQPFIVWISKCCISYIHLEMKHRIYENWEKLETNILTVKLQINRVSKDKVSNIKMV